jgi:virulence-associated protein VagC
VLLPYDEPWQTLVGSLALFSDDFMAEHEQPATRERESARA